jgi:hypothetical protein
MIRAMRAIGETRKLTYDAESFSVAIRGDDGSDHRLFLGNAYDAYLAASRWEKGNVLRHFASLPRATEDVDELTWEAVRPKLLPRVRERFYHEVIALQTQLGRFPGDGRDHIPTRPITEHFTLEICCDEPQAIRTISAKGLEDWKTSFDAALAIAKENLWHRSNEEFTVVQPGLYVSPWQDSHDASRLFLHELIWQLKVKGDHVVVAPNRDLLLVTGSDDVEGLTQMGALADAALQEARPMSGIALRLVSNRWEPYLPPIDCPAYWPMKKAAMRGIAIVYDEQAELLNKLHEKTNQDIFVASYTVMQLAADESWYSWGVWVEEVTHALLPEVDRVHFGSTDSKGRKQNLGWAQWDKVREVCGELMEPTDLYPPRYRIREFPSADQLARLQLTPMEAAR